MFLFNIKKHICYVILCMLNIDMLNEFLLFSLFFFFLNQPFPHPQARQPPKSQPKSGGAMSIIMPIYTVGIIVFFLYTVLKVSISPQFKFVTIFSFSFYNAAILLFCL